MAGLVAFIALAVPAVGASAPSVPAWQQQAVAQLAQLQVKPAAAMKGYSRDRFGQAWSDVDDNGCNTRDDILQRDLNPFTLKSGSACQVAKGTLHDPYTGKTIKFVRAS
jgi:hypothetical protein